MGGLVKGVQVNPAGFYPLIGSGDTREDVTLDDYIKYQERTGSRVDITLLNTTVAQETDIRKRIENQGGRAPGFCASGVSDALGGVCGVNGSLFPGTLNSQAKKAKCP